jgi:two-component system, chemotaxis family, protein-glutamate methylesterase/glutaminase
MAWGERWPHGCRTGRPAAQQMCSIFRRMERKNIIVIGASAGGVEALRAVLEGLPAGLDAALFVVLHTWPSAKSILASVLQTSCALPVAEAVDGAPILMGRISVSRPDMHLLLDKSTMRLTRGPKENRSRPSVDALFRSAALAHSGRVVGVVLTGALDDGTAGMWSIKDRGGTTIVQDPEEAKHASMPSSAIEHVSIDHVLPLRKIGPLITQLSHEEVTMGDEKPVASKTLEIETRIAMEGRGLQLGVMDLGPKTAYTCPECHGVLVKLEEGSVPRFRCHTGHAYTISTLLSEVTESIEARLWDALRGIEEGVMLLNEAARHLRSSKADARMPMLLEARAKKEEARADLVRAVVLDNAAISEESVPTPAKPG